MGLDGWEDHWEREIHVENFDAEGVYVELANRIDVAADHTGASAEASGTMTGCT